MHTALRQSQRKTIDRAELCRDKFLRFFPDGFEDETYLDWERNYKFATHEEWKQQLNRAEFSRLLREKEYAETAYRALRIEGRSNLLFSFEKMALRDATRGPAGARAFAQGLFDFVYGPGGTGKKFDAWVDVVAGLPKKQSRVLTWPVVTVFGFMARPDIHFYFKPTVTRRAAREYGYELPYTSRPSWKTYAEILKFAEVVRQDVKDLRPRDMIDIQSFLWVQGSDEYEE